MTTWRWLTIKISLWINLSSILSSTSRTTNITQVWQLNFVWRTLTSISKKIAETKLRTWTAPGGSWRTLSLPRTQMRWSKMRALITTLTWRAKSRWLQVWFSFQTKKLRLNICTTLQNWLRSQPKIRHKSCNNIHLTRLMEITLWMVR